MPKMKKVRPGTVIRTADFTKVYTCLADLGDEGLVLKAEDGTIALADPCDLMRVTEYVLIDRDASALNVPAAADTPEPSPAADGAVAVADAAADGVADPATATDAADADPATTANTSPAADSPATAAVSVDPADTPASDASDTSAPKGRKGK